MDIKVYGTDTPGHKLVLSVISELLLKAKISFSLTEITDVSKFLAKGIESIPAIQMDDDHIIGLKSNGSFSKSLRDAVNEILSTQNYGTLSKFIIPIDFSDTSLNALSYGHRLATDLSAVTKVLHVYKPKPTINTDLEVDATSQQEVALRLDKLVDSINQDCGGDILSASLVSSDFKVGFAVDSILESINEDHAELVIIGSSGSSNVLKKVFGSVSLDIVSKSPSPVLLVPQKARYRGIKKVLLAVDHTTIEKGEIDSLSQLCSQLDTELHIVHVSNNATAQIDTSEIKSNHPGLKIKTTILNSNDVVDAINNYAITHQIDLVSLSPRSKTILSYIFSGSVTTELALTSDIPLYILK